MKALQAGLKNALAKESSDMQYKMVAGQMAAPLKRPATIPAGAGRQQEAIDALGWPPTTARPAFAALLTVQNPAMVDVLYDLARQNPAHGPTPQFRALRISSRSRAIRPCANTSYTVPRTGGETSPKVQNKLLKALSKPWYSRR